MTRTRNRATCRNIPASFPPLTSYVRSLSFLKQKAKYAAEVAPGGLKILLVTHERTDGLSYTILSFSRVLES